MKKQGYLTHNELLIAEQMLVDSGAKKSSEYIDFKYQAIWTRTDGGRTYVQEVNPDQYEIWTN